MKILSEISRIIFEGLMQFSALSLFVITLSAIIISGVYWAFCHYFVIKRNGNFHPSASFHPLLIAGSILTFLIIMVFAGMTFTRQVASIKIHNWKTNLEDNHQWQNNTFKEAFYGVKKLNKEDFTNYKIPEKGGSYIPMTFPESQVEVGYIFADRAAENFDENHPFLGLVIQPSNVITRDLIRDDISQWFKNGKGTYPLSNAVNLVSGKMKDAFLNRIPGIFHSAKIILAVLLFINIVLVPFTLIYLRSKKRIVIRIDFV